MVSLFLFSCNEDEPTSPEGETPEGEVLADASIGSEGGTLTTEDFILTVPSGSFSSNANLNLYEEPDTNDLPTVSQKCIEFQGFPKILKVL